MALSPRTLLSTDQGWEQRALPVGSSGRQRTGHPRGLRPEETRRAGREPGWASQARAEHVEGHEVALPKAEAGGWQIKASPVSSATPQSPSLNQTLKTGLRMQLAVQAVGFSPAPQEGGAEP